MEVRIGNWRGLLNARFKVSAGRLALVAGENEAGKSSMIGAIRAGLTGRALPQGVNKKSATDFVNDRADDGFVELIGAQGGIKITLPDAEVMPYGDAPTASELATGVTSLLTMKADERIAALTKLLNALPTEADLVRRLVDLNWPMSDQNLALRTKGTPEDQIPTPVDEIGQIVRELRRDGWDAIHEKRIQLGRKLKGRWEEVTGKNYGSKAAADWVPENWPKNFRGDDLEGCRENARKAADDLEAALRSSGADAQKVADQKKKADALDGYRAELKKAEDALPALIDEETRLMAVRDALPPASGDPQLPCAHCGAFNTLSFKGGQPSLHAGHKPLLPAELDQRRSEKAKADGKAAGATSDVGAKRREITRLEALVRESEASAKWTADNPQGEAVDLEPLRERKANREAIVKMVEQRNAARDRHEDIVLNQDLVDLLAPSGLRASSVADAVEAFNTKVLAPLCETAEWKPITIAVEGTNVEFRYGGRLVGPWSTSGSAF